MKDNTILTEDLELERELNKIFIGDLHDQMSGTWGLDYEFYEMHEEHIRELSDLLKARVKQLLAKKMEEREKEIADQLNEIDRVEYNFWNRKDGKYPSVRIHSGKYRHYFLSESGLGGAVKEMFNWIKSNI